MKTVFFRPYLRQTQILILIRGQVLKCPGGSLCSGIGGRMPPEYAVMQVVLKVNSNIKKPDIEICRAKPLKILVICDNSIGFFCEGCCGMDCVRGTQVVFRT